MTEAQDGSGRTAPRASRVEAIAGILTTAMSCAAIVIDMIVWWGHP